MESCIKIHSINLLIVLKLDLPKNETTDNGSNGSGFKW